MFKMKKMRNRGNVTCPFISEFKIDLWPSPTTPQFIQPMHGFTYTLPHEIYKKQANKALKYSNGKPKIKGE